MERAIHETAEYCRQRETFGKPLLDNQYVQFKLAELATEVELLRSLTYRTVGMFISVDWHSHHIFYIYFYFLLLQVE